MIELQLKKYVIEPVKGQRKEHIRISTVHLVVRDSSSLMTSTIRPTSVKVFKSTIPLSLVFV